MLSCGTLIIRVVYPTQHDEVHCLTYSHETRSGSSWTFIAVVFIIGLAIGSIAVVYFNLQTINQLKDRISTLENQISRISGNQTNVYQNVTIYQNATALTEIYAKSKDSVVLVRNTMANGSAAQGSGFVYNFSGTMIVITNNHVVHGASTVSVTFSDGNGYAARINGTDAYADLAVLTVDAPESEYKPLDVVSSSTLRVGDPVIAIGNPYGLVGSMTTGVVSALGRTISEEQYTGGFAIANIIQMSAPINPGNSGGPLLNDLGSVVGVTAAIVSESQGVGFAVPSNAIQREINQLVTTGGYDGHSYLGVSGRDMDYETAQQMGVNATYGWLVATVTAGGPSATAGVQVNDIIVGLNSTNVRSGDEMSSYLEEHTLPNETLIVTVYRGTSATDIPVTLGRRPAPPA